MIHAISKIRKALLYGLLVLVNGLPATVSAQAYPSAPITLVAPFPAGGGTDGIARAVAQALSNALGKPVVVENRPGAAGSIGSVHVVRSKPDGYTLLLGSNGPIAINPGLDPSLPYDPSRDLKGVGAIASVPFLLGANAKFEANNIGELVKMAKAEPGKINFASAGTGTTNHLVGELLKTMTGIDMVHIPYKGVSAAMNDVAGGVVQLMSGDISTMLPLIQQGKIKPLAVTGIKRSALIPEVPTIAESGVTGFEANGWFGLYAPAKTPAKVVQTLETAMTKVIADKGVIERVQSLGGTILPLSGKAFDDFSAKERNKWKQVIDAHQLVKSQ